MKHFHFFIGAFNRLPFVLCHEVLGTLMSKWRQWFEINKVNRLVVCAVLAANRIRGWRTMFFSYHLTIILFVLPAAAAAAAATNRLYWMIKCLYIPIYSLSITYEVKKSYFGTTWVISIGNASVDSSSSLAKSLF